MHHLADALTEATSAPGADLASPALVIARVEYPRLNPRPYIERLDAMGHEVLERLAQQGIDPLADRLNAIHTLNQYLFDEQRFSGNRGKYEDPRNSCLNEVLDRRTGIPITMSLVYLEVARRAGLSMHGVNFPGHFLVRCPGVKRAPLCIIDPFHGGALLSEGSCKTLLRRHAGEDVEYSRAMLAPATRAQIVVRMLLNLKHLYVHMRSFPQAYLVTELLVTMTPSALSELRDRGLLAYHLNDMTGALRDLQTYLKLSGMTDLDQDERKEHVQIWEHVKTLRRRVAALN
jgi:regulator of sirC expression with transglutaminase-like and TPR domain